MSLTACLHPALAKRATRIRPHILTCIGHTHLISPHFFVFQTCVHPHVSEVTPARVLHRATALSLTHHHDTTQEVKPRHLPKDESHCEIWFCVATPLFNLCSLSCSTAHPPVGTPCWVVLWAFEESNPLSSFTHSQHTHTPLPFVVKNLPSSEAPPAAARVRVVESARRITSDSRRAPHPFGRSHGTRRTLKEGRASTFSKTTNTYTANQPTNQQTKLPLRSGKWRQ